MKRTWAVIMIAASLVACGKADGSADTERKKREAYFAEVNAALARPDELRARLGKAREAAPASACTKAAGKRALFVERALLDFLVTGAPAINLDDHAGDAPIDDWTPLSSPIVQQLRKYDWEHAREKRYDKTTSDRTDIAREIIKMMEPGLGDLVIIVELQTKKRPVVSGPTFEAGKLAGRAVAVDPAAGKAVCAVEFSATSSTSIQVSTGTVGGVAVTRDGPIGDLTNNARKKILAAFAKAGLDVVSL